MILINVITMELNKKYYLIANSKINDKGMTQFITKLIVSPKDNNEPGVSLGIAYSDMTNPFSCIMRESVLYFENKSEAENILNICINNGYIEFQIIELDLNATF